MSYQWDWGVLFNTSEIYGQTYLWLFCISVGWTLLLSVSSWAIALIMGTLIGVMRGLPSRPARLLALAYVQVFRGIPLIVQMFLWYFILPELWGAIKHWVMNTDTRVVQFTAASLCLGLFTSARLAEQVHAGIGTLTQGAKNAAKALGFTPVQSYRYIILPQVFRMIFPPLTSEMMNLIKNSSIAMTVGFAELTFRAREVGETTFSYFESFTIVTIAYIAIAYTANRVASLYETRMNKIGLFT